MKQECADEEYAAVFRVYDSDGNGIITSDEFRAAMNSMGENLSKLEAGEMIVEADSDGDGQIDLKGTCKHKVFNSKLQKIHTIRSMIFNLVWNEHDGIDKNSTFWLYCIWNHQSCDIQCIVLFII